MRWVESEGTFNCQFGRDLLTGAPVVILHGHSPAHLDSLCNQKFVVSERYFRANFVKA